MMQSEYFSVASSVLSTKERRERGAILLYSFPKRHDHNSPTGGPAVWASPSSRRNVAESQRVVSRKCSTLHLPLYKELMKSQIQAEGGRGEGIAEISINIGRISTLVISELTTMTLCRS